MCLSVRCAVAVSFVQVAHASQGPMLWAKVGLPHLSPSILFDIDVFHSVAGKYQRSLKNFGGLSVSIFKFIFVGVRNNAVMPCRWRTF